MKRFRTFSFSISISMAVIGCVRSPSVELTGMRLEGLGIRGASLMAELRIDNPNAFAITADSIRYDLQASDPNRAGTWVPVTKATSTQNFRIAKRTGTRIEIPIILPYRGLSTPIRSLIEDGTFDYRITGVVYLHKPLRWNVPFAAHGDLSINGLGLAIR